MQPNMKMLQQMQDKLSRMQEELAQTPVEGSAGGGAVKVTVNGMREVQSIKIDPEAVDPDDIGLLEDTILAAISEAMKNAEELATQKMSAITGGLNIPGIF